MLLWASVKFDVDKESKPYSQPDRNVIIVYSATPLSTIIGISGKVRKVFIPRRTVAIATSSLFCDA